MSPSQPRSRARITFVLLCIMAFIMYVDRTNISVAAPVMSKELGFSNTHLGFIFSAFALAYSCFMIPGGWHSDRIGSRKGLLLYGSLWAIATIVTGLVGSLFALVAARFFVGIGEAPIYPTAARMIARVIPEDRRGAAQGVMHATGRIANALAPLIVTALIVSFSWRLTFIILGGVTLVYMVVMYLGLNEAKKHREGEPVRQPSAPAPARTPVNWPDMIRRVWPATAACFCHGWVLWFFLNWIPSFFSQRYGMKLSHNAIFSALVLLGGSLGTAAGGMLTDWRFRCTGNRLRARREMIVCGFLSSIVFLVPLLFTRDITISSICLGLAFFCSELADSPLWVVGTEVSREHSATSSACTFTGMALAGAVSPIVVGMLLDISHGRWVVAFAASIIVLLLGPLFTMKIRLDDEPPSTGNAHQRVTAPEPDIAPAPSR
ncbi:MFS transporter [Paraburkholderia solisilvae]|uniref:Putative sulfoacetate transporter SauU n=1 Tax=Paraburkholderia solisilvae TaxID=624376 RepID=A0A6J5E292_9BURK|nr:MFS transporter [Paraburkholderia solisilvae]CAB3759531.1 putative sulfoacetate transporter SauU [Paraburkholderia solisilvae]